MKVSTLLSTSALYAAVTAWQVQFHTRSNIGLTMHGTKDAACNTIGWNHGRTAEDVDWIDFDPATSLYPDPSKLTVYPGQLCGAGGVSFGKGLHKPAKGFLVGSYSVK